MAKTATDIPITQGSGVNLSNFALASGRRRQTVILADADDSGEALVAELPAHDSVDRGSPLKIGGRASAAPVLRCRGERSHRCLAQPRRPARRRSMTIEPATVYDGGRRAVQFAEFATIALNGSTSPIVAATASVKTKVLAVNVQCARFYQCGLAGIHGWRLDLLVRPTRCARHEVSMSPSSPARRSSTRHR